MDYFWLKALHIISIIAWMATLLYLPRLFVYHAAPVVTPEQSETFKVMERRLLRAIATPAMVASWVFGIWLIVQHVGWNVGGWLHAKLLFVVLLSGYHGFLVRWQRGFANDENTRSSRFYRLVNEVPTVLMIGIVIFAVVKPF